VFLDSIPKGPWENQKKLQVYKVNKDILRLDELSRDFIINLGLTPPDYDPWIPGTPGYDRKHNLDFDWNNDGLNDIVITPAGRPEINGVVGVYMQKKENDQIIFESDSNYFVTSEGDVGSFWINIGDLDGDGLVDMVLPTANYHGDPNNFPEYYADDCYHTPDKLFINNGTGFDKYIIGDFEVSGGASPDCPNSVERQAIYLPNENRYGILTNMAQGVPLEDSVGWYVLHKFNSDGTYTSAQVFDRNLFSIPSKTDMHGTSQYPVRPLLINTENNKVSFSAPYRKSSTTTYTSFGIVDFEINNDLGVENILLDTSIDLPLHENEGITLCDTWGTYPVDLDNDGEVEIVTLQHVVPLDQGYFGRIVIYDINGVNITDTWIDKDQGGFDYSFDLSNHHANGIHLKDLNGDGYIDIIPENGWFFDRSDSSLDPNFTSLVFMNNGENFEIYYMDFSSEHKNSAGLYQGLYPPSISVLNGFRFPVDINNDGFYEILQIRFQGLDLIEIAYDNDNDGVRNTEDAFPNNSYAISQDIDGNPIFYLPSNNYNIGVKGTSCIDQSNGQINISLVDQAINYTTTLNGNESINFNAAVGYSQNIDSLEDGFYELCFSVEGQSNYIQCFTLNVKAPLPLSVYSRVDSSKKLLSINMEGSDQYTVILNGKTSIATSNYSELKLNSGINFLEVYTDKECQGVYTEEIFVSEQVQYYPNPTTGPLQIFVSGEDTKANISINGINGYCYYDQIMSVTNSRKIELDLSSYNNGIYIIQIEGETVSKSFKIIKK
tara:strand:- start:4576 stop:6903 length:2328 start_codon:yes stop_codon:yes gene_type:complete